MKDWYYPGITCNFIWLLLLALSPTLSHAQSSDPEVTIVRVQALIDQVEQRAISDIRNGRLRPYNWDRELAHRRQTVFRGSDPIKERRREAHELQRADNTLRRIAAIAFDQE